MIYFSRPHEDPHRLYFVTPDLQPVQDPHVIAGLRAAGPLVRLGLGMAARNGMNTVLKRASKPVLASHALCSAVIRGWLSHSLRMGCFSHAGNENFFYPQTMPEAFPAVQGGGSLILAWQIRNKRVLVVGGGEVPSPHLRLISSSKSRRLPPVEY